MNILRSRNIEHYALEWLDRMNTSCLVAPWLDARSR